MNTTSIARSAALVVAASILATPLSHACSDGATQTELTFTSAWPSCDQSLIPVLVSGYGLTDDSWQPAGQNDNCNEALPFAKTLNAVALIMGAPTQGPNLFHQRGDYALEARATDTPYHGDVYLRFYQTHPNNPEASTDSNVRTDLDCPIFDWPGTANPDPAQFNADMLPERAAVIVHEHWHSWLQAHDYNPHHQTGPTGSCSATGAACDYFYPHAPGSLFPGEQVATSVLGGLDAYDVENGVGVYFHSPYQVMAEFQSDLALYGSSAIMPYVIRLEAQNLGNTRLRSNFVNAVPYTINIPLPFPKEGPRAHANYQIPSSFVKKGP